MQLSRKKIARRWALGLLASCFTAVTVAHAALTSIGASDVGFLAVGPGGLKIEGKGHTLSAKEDGGNLKVTVGLTDLKTGMSLRDDHLKKAIKASKYPSAVLSVKRSDLKFPADKQKVEGTANGQFTFYGTTKPLPFKYQVNRTGSDYHVTGLASVDFTKHGMEKPCYLGVCVDENVKIKVKFKLRE